MINNITDLKNLKFAVGFVKSKNPFALAEMWFARHKEKIPEKYICSHAFTMFSKDFVHDKEVKEGGVIYESNLAGDQRRSIDKYLNNDYEVWLYTPSLLLADSAIQCAQAYAEGAKGKVYDLNSIAGFAFKLLPQSKYATLIQRFFKSDNPDREDFCSEYMTKIVRTELDLPLCPGLNPEDISPSMANEYCANARHIIIEYYAQNAIELKPTDKIWNLQAHWAKGAFYEL